MVLGEAFHRQVASRLAERLAAEGKQTFLAFSPENIRYLTGVSFPDGNARPRIAHRLPHLGQLHRLSSGSDRQPLAL